jgi:hypothetical protein
MGEKCSAVTVQPFEIEGLLPLLLKLPSLKPRRSSTSMTAGIDVTEWLAMARAELTPRTSFAV